MEFNEIQECCRSLSLKINTSEFESYLIKLKTLYFQQKDSLSEKEKAILDADIKNSEILLRNPKKRFHLELGGQIYFNAIHQDDRPYTKEELEELNHLSKYSKIFLGDIRHYRCAYCDKPFGTQEVGRKKFCNPKHRKEYHMLNKIRLENGAESIFWNTYNGNIPISRNGTKIIHRTKDGISENILKTKKSKWAKDKEIEIIKESETKTMEWL